jgi:hypothetical protein
MDSDETSARGTGEQPSGITGQTSSEQYRVAAGNSPTKGFGSAGFSLFTELRKLIPTAAASPVNYPVSWLSVAGYKQELY